MANGTGFSSGRVGSCHIHLKPLSFLRGFFIYANPNFIQRRIEDTRKGAKQDLHFAPFRFHSAFA
jgi:hypothetical protein